MQNVLDKIIDFIWEATKYCCDVVMLSLFAVLALITCAYIAVAGFIMGIFYRRSPSETIHELFTELWETLASDIDEEDEESEEAQ